MPRFDVVIDHEASIVDWTVPDFVIALALADQGTTVLAQNGFHTRRKVVSHQATGASSLRSALIANGTLSVPAGKSPFSTNSSGITIFSFSIKSSNVSAPVARPGTSSLEATQTRALSSH